MYHSCIIPNTWSTFITPLHIHYIWDKFRWVLLGRSWCITYFSIFLKAQVLKLQQLRLLSRKKWFWVWAMASPLRPCPPALHAPPSPQPHWSMAQRMAAATLVTTGTSVMLVQWPAAPCHPPLKTSLPDSLWLFTGKWCVPYHLDTKSGAFIVSSPRSLSIFISMFSLIQQLCHIYVLMNEFISRELHKYPATWYVIP